MAKANAHGYISTPPSRQAECAQGVVQCGPIKYEPQSVEGPKGLRSCSGGLPQFAELGATRVAYVDGNDTPPNATVTHTVDLSQFGGRQKLLAIWSIGDTPNAFYNCVDLLLGGGQPSSTTSSTPSTTTTPPATTTPPSGTAKAWAPGTKYAVGDTVTYNGKTYQCLQAHTAYDPTWTPATTPALWKEI
ncbi:Chitinase D [Mycobacterium simulans]|uniref:Chitinase D n=1 Tax=Mycobacterium simulans TaxID=627089 RepID=A0A7Z7N9U3_9MYCO|nr:carbohydrate-binding protein [Mycobacterium simulans]SOJ55143.1 Chitinase D [Mycobacterium simulans]